MAESNIAMAAHSGGFFIHLAKGDAHTNGRCHNLRMLVTAQCALLWAAAMVIWATRGLPLLGTSNTQTDFRTKAVVYRPAVSHCAQLVPVSSPEYV